MIVPVLLMYTQLACLVQSVLYSMKKGRVSGTGSDRRWYIDQVRKKTSLPQLQQWEFSFTWQVPDVHCVVSEFTDSVFAR